MYGLADSVDLRFFSGKLLQQVCVGANEVILNFDDNISILIESSFGCKLKDKNYIKYQDSKSAANTLTSFLQNKVSIARRENNVTLQIYFENGDFIEIFDDNDKFESFVINVDKRTIVV